MNHQQRSDRTPGQAPSKQLRDGNRTRFYLDTVYEFVQDIAKQTTAEEVLRRFLRMVTGTFVIREAIIVVRRIPDGVAEVVACQGMDAAISQRMSERLHDSLLAEPLDSNTSTELPYTSSESAPTGLLPSQVMLELGMKTMCMVRVQGQLDAYAGFGALPSDSGLSQDQNQLLSALVKHTELALGNLFFYESVLQENQELRAALQQRSKFGDMVGQSIAMQELYQRIQQVAEYPSYSVLVSGESGTGKELIARAIHSHSPRRDRRFLAINCAALPQELVESELFGHEKGAFTGATAAKPGLFEAVEGGTLFLDEIAEMTPTTQAKLLRALEQKEIMRVGGSQVQGVDARIVAATNRDIEQAIAAGDFRADLRYRFDVHLRPPALRERKEDIPLLAEVLLEDIAQENEQATKRVAQDALRRLMNHGWPGNVRELRSVLRSAVLVTSKTVIRAQDIDLPDDPTQVLARTGLSLSDSVERLKRTMIENALLQHDGNRTHAAAQLGMTRQTLQKMVRRLGIE